MQNAVDQLASAGVDVHGEMVEATEHDGADVIVQRAEDLPHRLERAVYTRITGPG